MINTDYKFGEVHDLTSQIEIGDEKVHFKNIFSNENGGVVLIAFKSGQVLDTHTATGEVMVTVLEGVINFTMLEKCHTMKAGEFLLMGEGVPHSVVAKADSKVMLTKIKA